MRNEDLIKWAEQTVEDEAIEYSGYVEVARAVIDMRDNYEAKLKARRLTLEETKMIELGIAVVKAFETGGFVDLGFDGAALIQRELLEWYREVQDDKE